jgi:hypothetical protein
MNWQIRDHSDNPLIKGMRWVYADPTVAVPEESPDGRWHMFTCSGIRITHHVSDDGIRWGVRRNYIWRGYHPSLFCGSGEYYIYYQRIGRPSVIVARHSADLERWSSPQVVLRPTLEWEGRSVGNSCLLRWREKYFFYYSANRIWLPDVGVPEPKYVGVATGAGPLGPFEKKPEPVIAPSADHLYRNYGAGGFKAYAFIQNRLTGFENGIYRDADGKCRSAILVMESEDGLAWRDVGSEPLIAPSSGWKSRLVYQLDVKRRGDEFWVYYNARSGGWFGRETIGLSIVKGLL